MPTLQQIAARAAHTAIALVLGTSLADAAVLYTFSNDGPNPYSFSLLELNPLSMSGAFALAPFQLGGLTFTQATLSQTGGLDCFQFGSAGAALSATPSSCGLGANAPDGGVQSLFKDGGVPGTYTSILAASEGNAPAAPDRLTIQDVAAVEYSFSRGGPNPYSFSFLELRPLTGTGPFAIAPFQVGGQTFTQATLSQSVGFDCFEFGSARATLTAAPGFCGLGANAPDGGFQSLFAADVAPGTYASIVDASQGNAPGAPTQLVIQDLPGPIPEPPTAALAGGGLVVLAGLSLRRRHRHGRAVTFPTDASARG